MHADLPGPLWCGYFESCRSCCQWTSSRYCHHFCHLDAKKPNFSSTWLLRSSQSWFLWFDLLQLGTRTVLITQNQHMNCSMNPLHDRTRIGWVGWIGPNNFCDTSEQSERLHCIIYVSCIILHFIPFTSSKSQWISVFLMRRTSTSRCSQKAFHPYPFCLLSASCLRGCKDTTTERG